MIGVQPLQRRAGDADGGDHLLGLVVAERRAGWRSARGRRGRDASRRPPRCRSRPSAEKIITGCLRVPSQVDARVVLLLDVGLGVDQHAARHVAVDLQLRGSSSACAAASSGVSANFTPPAFMRPPVSTWDLMTVGAADVLGDRGAPPRRSWRSRCGDAGCPRLATISRDSYSKNLMGARQPILGAACACVLACSVVLLLPAHRLRRRRSASSRSTGDGVQYGDGRTSVAGEPARGRPSRLARRRRVELRGRAYPYERRVPDARDTATTAAPRQLRLQAPSRSQHGSVQRRCRPGGDEATEALRAYVYPRPRSRSQARSRAAGCGSPSTCGPRRTCALSGRSRPSTSARGARGRRRRWHARSPAAIGRGRFKATATVKLPRLVEAARFRYGSCFRYSEGSGMGAPRRAAARSATASERRAPARDPRRSRAPARRSPAAR